MIETSKIMVVDATLRDGGLVNDFAFSEEFVRDLYETNVTSGVDVMEFGYKADKNQFSVDDYGPWKFCDEGDIRRIVGDNQTGLKIAVMADVGRCNYEEDFPMQSESPIDIVRVATYLHQIPEAILMIESLASKGYHTTVNIMAISTATDKEIKDALDLLGKTPVEVFYIVDSYGALDPKRIQELAAIYLEYAQKYDKKVGIHAHNNMQLAVANTIAALEAGVTWMDATYSGMGRGAGNCMMEIIISYLQDAKFNIMKMLQFIDQYIQALKVDGVVWGYDTQYLLTGSFNQHPRTAIAYTKEKRTSLEKFYEEIHP